MKGACVGVLFVQYDNLPIGRQRVSTRTDRQTTGHARTNSLFTQFS